MTIKMIVAHSRNRVIGNKGQLPDWGKIDGDMERFKELTTGHAVVMGRATFDSLPDEYRPLPNRSNFVLTRTAEPARLAWSNTNSGNGLEYMRDDDDDLANIRCTVNGKQRDVWIIGGESIYRLAMPIVDEIYTTEIHRDVEGDRFFPEIPPEFALTERVNEWPTHSFCVYKRRK